MALLIGNGGAARRGAPVFFLTTLLALAPAAAPAEDEHLPTPYTAEQIRDASPLGLEIVTRITTPEGVQYSLGTVVSRTPESASFTEQEATEAGEPSGDTEPTPASVSWEELRRHALFPADAASRERTSRATPLGDLEGWLYRLPGRDGALIEFFFADDYPGAPVVYEHTRDGDLVMRAEQIERRQPD